MKLITALADRLCSHRPRLLRPFTDQDWMAYSGCEEKAPEIAETDAGTFVLDGKAVNVDLYRIDGDPEDWDADIFTGVFADEAEARAVIEFLIQHPGLTPKLLGEPVGML
jgi:hypothetical protein